MPLSFNGKLANWVGGQRNNLRNFEKKVEWGFEREIGVQFWQTPQMHFVAEGVAKK